MNKLALILSCEHAVNTIPKGYHELFLSFKKELDSHEGIDFGALEMGLHLKEIFNCQLIHAPTSRLFIDYNRSLHHARCFSKVTKQLPAEAKEEIIEHYYLPYREHVIQGIDHLLKLGKQVLHCSIHSFTPILNHQVRNAEIGFLYNPQRVQEKLFSSQWKQEIHKLSHQYRIRMNYPYKGTSDGLTTALRKKYSPSRYLGIEIECNQALTRNQSALNTLKNIIATSLKQALTSWNT